jgi:uncharacterized membrane protein
VTAPAAEGGAGAPRPPGPRPARAFVWLAGGAGLFFALLTPPLQAPDEIRHLVRASAIARGQLLAEARPGEFASVEVPRDLVLLEERLGARRLYRRPQNKPNRAALAREAARAVDESDRLRVAVPSLYSPLPYLPQAAAMAALRPFGASPLAHVWAGRLANLALYLVLVALALSCLPAHRWTFFVVAATPIAVFEAAALGADAPTNGLAFLFSAWTLRAAAARGRMGARELGAWIALAALLSLAKPGYAPLALLAPVVPGARFATPRARAAALSAVLAAGVLPTALWLAMLQGLPLRPLVSDSDIAGQIAHVLAHPLDTLGVLARTLLSRSLVYLRSGVSDLGHLDVRFPTAAWAIYPLALGALAVFDGGRASPLRGWQRAWLVAVALVAWSATVLLAYVGWNPVGADVIRYVQGRYFLPFVALPWLALHRAAGGGLPAWGARAALAFAAGELLLGAALLLQRYWG